MCRRFLRSIDKSNPVRNDQAVNLTYQKSNEKFNQDDEDDSQVALIKIITI